ncbi:MAG: YkgJ family cysteine cluster protein [Verrucomicrobia bacterium]|nr:YkgJ family cysteine cluster protein [Verrucomicrobiota bacterium]MBS0645767.1 YkgJ family cysteine cluster protein [Verrucomicrobiota bacterium]
MTKWYAEGLKFKCTGCGKCCTGSPGYVWVNEEEIATMSQALGITVEVFYRRYIRRVGQRLSLTEKGPNYDCVFLEDGKTCRLYQARPKQCRTFPFWSHTLASKETWEHAAQDCEGINHPEAKHYSQEEIDSILDT